MSSESLAVNPSPDKVSGSTDSPTEDDCLGSDYLHSTEYKLATERFDNLILDYPKSIVNMLRDLHATRDIARFALTRSLSDFLRKKHNAKLSSPPRQVDAFYRTGMPALLADLVTQKENYVLEPDVEVAICVSMFHCTSKIGLGHRFRRIRACRNAYRIFIPPSRIRRGGT